MDIQVNAHVPFAQLAPEHRFFYGLATQAAILHLRPCLAAIQLVIGDDVVRRVWDKYTFTPADAAGFFEKPERLEPYLVHFAIKDPDFWCPRLAARRIPHRNRR
jgi:hypothetical protein